MMSLLSKTEADIFEISISPNPYTESITISTNNDNQEIDNLELFDSSSRIIIQKSVNGNKTILNNLGRLTNGVYFL
ncbi:MAG: T9SS type A sorting domain-containing protein [Algibacter sp.]